ncbi:MAG: DNA recombination protein RmuC [Eubacteriales bacterium]|nr:DNA recombination protein RmuC [Eubacteriales bacterium]
MNSTVLYICVALMILSAAVIAVSAFFIIRTVSGSKGVTRKELDDVMGSYGGMMMQAQKNSAEAQDRRLESLNTRMENFSGGSEQKLENIRRTLAVQMESLNKEIGSMQSLAENVDSLSKVLANVKTRGILGEYQAEAILRDMLSPYQYDKNVNTTGVGSDRVEFAVKVPDEAGRLVYLPIDSKFPLDTFNRLLEARDGSDSQEIKRAAAALAARLRGEAKDIRTKYVAPPRTTDFALLFVPAENLYYETLRLGLYEELQRDYRVMIVGPTSLSAFLASLETGYRAVAINKASEDVWRTLSAVKTEFGKFSDELDKARADLKKADKHLETMVGARTNVMMKKLDKVTELPEDEADAEFGFDGGGKWPEINLYGDGRGRN